MNHKNQLETVLAELRQEHRATGLPDAAEDRFLQALYETLAPSRQSWARGLAWGAGSAIAAVILIGLTLWLMRHPLPESHANNVFSQQPGSATNAATGPARRNPSPTPAIPAASHGSHKAPQAHNSAQSHWSAEAVRHAHSTPSRQQPLIETGFLVIPGREGLPTPSEASIVRVQLTKGDLQWYGFQVPPSSAAEMVRADFLVGQDGLARAIRLVQHQ